MSSNADSRKPGGMGIWPLRHRDFDKDSPKWDLDMRSCVLAWEITGRMDDWPGIGAWQYDQETVGDVNGGQVWKEAGRGSRGCSMWRFATPVATQKGRSHVATPSAGAPVATGGGTGGTCSTGSDVKTMLPILDKDWKIDDRLAALDFTRPKSKAGKDLWPKFPIGWYGISLAADKEQTQDDLFMPTDPRIVAVNFAGDPEMGSIVTDLNGSFEVDPDRAARVQAAWRVVKKPDG